MKKWEYTYIIFDVADQFSFHQEELLIAGEKGWELVCIHDNVAWLKRKKYEKTSN